MPNQHLDHHELSICDLFFFPFPSCQVFLDAIRCGLLFVDPPAPPLLQAEGAPPSSTVPRPTHDLMGPHSLAALLNVVTCLSKPPGWTCSGIQFSTVVHWHCLHSCGLPHPTAQRKDQASLGPPSPRLHSRQQLLPRYSSFQPLSPS